MLGRECGYQCWCGLSGILLWPLQRIYRRITLREELPALPGACSQATIRIFLSNIYNSSYAMTAMFRWEREFDEFDDSV